MRYAFFLLTVLVIAGCSTPGTTSNVTVPTAETTTPATPQRTYAGEWEVTVIDTPGGTVTGTLNLMDGPDGMTGNFISGNNTTKLRSVTSTEEGIRIEFYSSEYQTDVYMQLEGGPEASTLSGKTLSTYDTHATRK